MASETLARRYADAVFQLATEQDAVASVSRDLHDIDGAIFSDAAAKEFFLSPVIDRGEKIRILTASFAGKAHDVSLHTVLLLVRKRREALLPELVRQYDALEMRARGAQPLTIATAKELSPEELRTMVLRLEALYGKHFDARQKVDPGLIGGVRITMGDRRIDGSVAGRLQELSRTLFAKN